MLSNFKRIILNVLGFLATIATIGAICLLLFAVGVIRELTIAFWTELGVVSVLVIIMRIFWYKDTEFKVLTSKDFEDLEETVKRAIEDEVTDVDHFDKCINYINQNNYKTYVNNHTKNITDENYRYRLRERLMNFIRRIFKKPIKSRAYYNAKFLKRVEYRAAHLHKISSSSVLTLSRSPLIDDRNDAVRLKWSYIIGGTIITILLVTCISLIGFKPKDQLEEDVYIKLIIYVASILFTIAQTIFTAFMSTSINYKKYFRKIVDIIERYRSYKQSNPVGGINNASNINNTKS